MNKIPDTLPLSLRVLLQRHKDKIQWVDDERDTKDGYWIYLQDGWLFDRETTIIHLEPSTGSAFGPPSSARLV